jgi:Spy/CpxP family protein refolding chaperone
MRTVIILTMLAGTALAQQAPPRCQAEEKAVQRAKVLLQDQALPPQQLQAAQEALEWCEEQQAHLRMLKTQEEANQANLNALRERYKDSYPEVVALKAKLEELRAQEAALTRTSAKQSSGGLQTGLPDRWWKNPATAQSLGLTADQQKKMDDVFQQYRLKLIDLNAALEKEEVTLEPLVAAEPLDESKTAAQIDRVAQARAELEKANGRMLLGIRKQLTLDQWNKLNQGLSPATGFKYFARKEAEK